MIVQHTPYPEQLKMAVQDDANSADLQQIMKKSNLDPEVLAARLLENKIIDESILEDVMSRTSVTEKVKTLSDAVTKLGKAAYIHREKNDFTMVEM